jgi:transcription antitermination factor NusG
MSLEWFIFYTYPKSEKVIKKELEKFNYQIYLPLQKVQRQWKDRKKTIEVPLFSNYIFVRTLRENIYHILDFPKIVKYVAFEGKPATLKERDLDFINTACSYNLNISVSNLKKGEKIRIKSGVLKGYEGILIEHDGRKRFGLQLKEMNQIAFIDLNNTRFERIL